MGERLEIDMILRFWGIEIKKNTDECVKVIEETIFEIKLEEETL